MDIYNKKFLFLYRLASVIAIVILILSSIRSIIMGFENGFKKDLLSTLSIVINIISSLLLIIVIIAPQKIAIFSIVSFFYSFLILIMEPENQMGIFMYFLGITTLCVRGFFTKKNLFKSIFCLIVFLGLVFSELRFGKERFLNSLIQKLGYFFVFFVTTFFIHLYLLNLDKLKKLEKILDLKDYPTLNKRDANWLIEIMEGKKYDFIAIQSNLSLGTVKNRLKYIFEILEVGDKIGFMNKYSEFEIRFGKELSFKKNNKNDNKVDQK